MALETILKQPAERLRHVVRFRPGFVPTSALDAVAVPRGLVVGADDLDVEFDLIGGVFTVELSGGTDGESYLVTVKAESPSHSISMAATCTVSSPRTITEPFSERVTAASRQSLRIASSAVSKSPVW